MNCMKKTVLFSSLIVVNLTFIMVDPAPTLRYQSFSVSQDYQLKVGAGPDNVRRVTLDIYRSGKFFWMQGPDGLASRIKAARASH